MAQSNEEEWRALIDRLAAGTPAEPLQGAGTQPAPLQGEVAPMFSDPKARQRVGDLITKSILGVPAYRLYCGEPASQP